MPVDGKPLRPRLAARHDVEAAIRYYRREAGPEIALRFIDALEATYGLISRHPAAGSPRYAHELQLPGLRSQALNGFPFLVFYLEQAAFIDVWRLLHAKRDIPASLIGS